MSLFDDFSVNARACADKVSKKADTAVEISRLKITESRVQHDISKSLKLLGAKVYKAYSTDDSNLNISDDVENIRDMYERLRFIRSKITELKNSRFTNSDHKSTEDKG